MSGLERCPDYRGVRKREVTGLERCPDYIGVRIR